MDLDYTMLSELSQSHKEQILYNFIYVRYPGVDKYTETERRMAAARAGGGGNGEFFARSVVMEMDAGDSCTTT